MRWDMEKLLGLGRFEPIFKDKKRNKILDEDLLNIIKQIYKPVNVDIESDLDYAHVFTDGKKKIRVKISSKQKKRSFWYGFTRKELEYFGDLNSDIVLIRYDDNGSDIFYRILEKAEYNKIEDLKNMLPNAMQLEQSNNSNNKELNRIVWSLNDDRKLESEGYCFRKLNTEDGIVKGND
jgi:hypothetical protein